MVYIKWQGCVKSVFEMIPFKNF